MRFGGIFAVVVIVVENSDSSPPTEFFDDLPSNKDDVLEVRALLLESFISWWNLMGMEVDVKRPSIICHL